MPAAGYYVLITLAFMALWSCNDEIKARIIRSDEVDWMEWRKWIRVTGSR